MDIGQVLCDKAPNQEPMVKELTDAADGKLKLIRDTFPTYTLHDEVHATNVVRLMGELLGPRLTDLSGLEAAMLILAAHYHDIGMVYTPAELAAVSREPEFQRYLDTHPEAYLAVRTNGGEPPPGVPETTAVPGTPTGSTPIWARSRGMGCRSTKRSARSVAAITPRSKR